MKWEKEAHKKVVFNNTLAFSLVTFNYPKIDKDDAIEKTKEKAVSKHLDSLKKKGVIEREGKTRGY
ncbi:MAG: hypothetical protein FWH23_00850 [Bacteroidales bacterium]|nr:hypothetical protein [Bacteroidales bacterium]